MKLRRLHVRRMPGIEDGFVVDRLEALGLVVGPNGSGKSTLCRAVRALLWPGLEPEETVSVEATWEDGPRRWVARRDGTTTTWQCDGVEREPPPYPGEGSAYCFTLRFGDLLVPDAPTDATVAREFRRQLSGGYDLQEVGRSEFGLRPRHGHTEDVRLRDRRRAAEQIKTAQRALAEREDEQRALERELDRARTAAARLGPLRAAVALSSARARLAALRAELDRLPPGLDRLRGDETERLDDLETERARLAADLEASRREIEALTSRAEAIGLEPDAVRPEELVAWRDRARELRELEAASRAWDDRATRARARRDEAAAGLDPRWAEPERPRLSEAGLREIEAFVERATELRRERGQLTAELAMVAGSASPGARGDLDRAIQVLRAWRDASGAGGALRRRALVLGIGLLAACPLAAWLGEPAAAWALALAGSAATLLAALSPRPGTTTRAAKQELERYGIDPPASWDAEGVRQRSSELERQWAASALAERAGERRAELARREASLGERERQLASERSDLRARLGIDPGAGELGAAGIARRILALDRSELDYREARAAREAASIEHAERLGLLGAFLSRHGRDVPADAAAAEAALDDLARRASEARSLHQQSLREAGRHAQLEERRADQRARRLALWSGAGVEPGDADGLRQRLAARTRLLELTAEAEACSREIREQEARMAAEPALRERSAAELAVEIEAAERLAASQTDLAHELGRLRERVHAARSGNALEAALAEVRVALDALEKRRDEALQHTAGRFLLDDVATDLDTHGRPRLLGRARELFARFTHHRYELLVADDGATSFRAVEAETGAGLALRELSDATRVQLLLAARLAYVGHVDAAARLPLLLDEVLATTDPERFGAVAASLVSVAREEDRQVLYLSADPADLARWNQVLCAEGLATVSAIDLGELRGTSLRVGGRVELEVPPLPAVPPPGTLDAEAYGERLGVPRVDLGRPAAALHLFHLLRDDLALLHSLLAQRVGTVGQWRLLASSGAAARLVGPREAERVSALADLADAFFAAWHVGRGRTVDTGALRRAGVGAAWVARLASLLEEIDGDAARLLETLERRDDERTRGFQTRVRDRLREHLVAEGHLDERERLDEAAIHARVRAALATHVDSGTLRVDDISTKVHELYHQGHVHAGSSGGNGWSPGAESV